MNRIDFLKNGLKNLGTVGTVTPSSRFLCKAMLKPVDFTTAKVLVELGAGNGVVTKHILQNMAADATLIAFEIEPHFCALLRQIDDDRLIVIEDSAEELPKHLIQNGFQQADHIISAIPFVILPKPLAHQIVTTCRDMLAYGGSFVQIHYSTLLRSLYRDIFPYVDINFVPMNLPPAFVFSCSK